MSKYLFIFILHFFFLETMAQSLQTSHILQEKASYLHLAEILYKQEKTYLKSQNIDNQLFNSISFEYTFVSIEMKMETEEGTQTWLLVKISRHFKMLEVWCKDANRQKMLEDLVKKFEETEKPSPDSQWLKLCQTQKIQKLLKIADKIAQEGLNCTSGDTYAPGYYNKIFINERGIELDQINHWNAKSLDRENYCLRKLLFFIPFNPLQEADIQYFHKIADGEFTHQIDDLLIYFRDYSSPSYRECGEKIKQRIGEFIQINKNKH